MKSISRAAGILLASVSVLALSMVVSATASAGVWEHCTKGKPNVEPPTKWTEHQCSTASGSGEWEWREVNGTEAVRDHGSLLLKDTKTVLGVSEVECFGTSEGEVGPKNHDRVTSITVVSCRGIKICKATGITVEPLHLPWQTEVYQTEGKKFDLLKGTTGEEPGWKVTCETIAGKITDECQAEGPESLLLENKATKKGTGELELLVLATFQHLRNANCTQGKPGSGEVRGSAGILQANGWGLRVS